MVKKSSEIRIRIGLDENSVPEKIEWMAEDNPNASDFQTVKAFMLSLFDPESYDTLRVDLWTKDMQVNEMDVFVFQTLRSLAQSYARATNNDEMAAKIQAFADTFGKETKVIEQG